MRKILFLLLVLVIMLPPVSATWITSGQFDQTAQATYMTDYINKTSDGLNTTLWSSGSSGIKWVNWSNPEGKRIDSVRFWREAAPHSPYIYSITTDTGVVMNNNTLMSVLDWTYINFTYPYNTTSFVYFTINGGAGWTGLAEVQYGEYERDTAPVIEVSADFEGNPVNGLAPLSVNFTDTSTGSPTDFNWSVSPSSGVYLSNATSQNTSMIFTLVGSYNITHGAANSGSSDIEVKSTYITVYDDNSTVSTGFLATDGTSGYPVNGAQVDLYDVENASWTNTTTIGGWAIITTLIGHTINAYANATGFEDADLLAQPAKAGSFYQIYMWPDVGFKNVSEGMVTAYFHVNDANTGDPIPGALISGGGENYGVMVNSTMFGLTTNAAGMASIAVQNNTNIYITTSKGGYQTATQAFATGPGSGGTDNVVVSIMLSKLTVTPTATMTTLPGQPGVYPTTVDPYSLLSPEEKQESLAGDVLDWAPMLINLFILLTVIGGIKMIAK